MSEQMNVRMSTRMMVTSTTAGTFYPTGSMMGFVDNVAANPAKGSSSSRQASDDVGTVFDPGAFVAIASSTNATPIVVTTATNHGMHTNGPVTIDGHAVNTNANGKWLVTVTGATTFSLQGSVGNGVGGATGQAYTGAPIPAGVNLTRMSKIAIVRSIEVLSLAAAGGTVSLVANDSIPTIIVPAFLSDGVLASDGKGRRVEFGPDGLPIVGGFAIITTGATASIVAVVYEIVDNR